MTSVSAASVSSEQRLPKRFLVLLVVGVIALVGFIVAAVLVASGSSAKVGQSSADQLVTYAASQRRAPTATSLPRLGGGAAVRLGGTTGHPVVVNFFASWCPACQRELKAVATVAREKIVPFVGVDTDDTSSSQALALLHKARADYPVGVGNASLAISYGAGDLPTTAFVNSKGRVVAIFLGALTEGELTRWVRDLAAGEPLSR